MISFRIEEWASRTSVVLSLGFVFHLVYILSVFDCYFTSPVVHGIQTFNAGKDSTEARRLVLIVADGLRADLLFNIRPFPAITNSPEVVAPFLHDVAKHRGAFGISHTRVPTESRPGHVAIIGGMYEDVSAVTKGWKVNPVDFDSVFNRSSHTFSFGSPDILPMFAKGAVPGKVRTWCYDEEEEDFTRDATELDVWSFEQLQELLHNSTLDTQLKESLHEDGVIFFLHLLGLDTTGHSYRPHSKEYMRNIQIVDDLAKQTENLLSDYFTDDKTSYIFTADHGMSNIGNHGDGNPDSTRTPLIAWGAGVRGPLPDSVPTSHDEYSSGWGLKHLLRQDVEQADIAALMTALLGLDFPANSVGVLPDINPDKAGYLSLKGGEEAIARIAEANAKTILEHYRKKHADRAARAIFYKPFSGLSDTPPGQRLLKFLESSLSSKKWRVARFTAAQMIRLSLDGLDYLQKYDRVLLRTIVTVGYSGWASYSASVLLFNTEKLRKAPPFVRWTILGVTTIALLSLWSLFAVQGDPVTFYIYVVFPCFFWYTAALRLWSPAFELVKNIRSRKKYDVGMFWKVIKTCAFVFASLQAMVYAYTHRSIWSIGFVFIGIVWPLTSWPRMLIYHEPWWFVAWTVSCLVTAIFPLRDVEQSEDLRVIVSGGISMLLAAILAACLLNFRDRGIGLGAFAAQLLLLLFSIFVTSDSVRRLSAKQGLPVSNQVAGWTGFLFSAAFPTLLPYRKLSPYAKLLTLFLSFSSCFVILSICAEGFFYLSYSACLMIWVNVEERVRSANEIKTGLKNVDQKPVGRTDCEEVVRDKTVYIPQVDDVRIAIFFLFFVQIAFFGTGNVASVSSFYLEPVYRLVPIFNPFLMAALLLFKIIAPYVMLSGAFSLLNSLLGLPRFSLFLIALSLTDGMTVTFFLNVRDTGSWLEIGQTISFFVITSLLLVWSAGICALGDWLMFPLIPTASSAVSVEKEE